MPRKSYLNIKFLIIILLYTGICWSGVGQKPLYVELKPVDKNHQLVDPVFQIEKVIDSTNSGGIIGYKGKQNRPFMFEKAIASEFEDFINNRFYYNPYGKRLKMAVSLLSISFNNKNSRLTNEKRQVVLSIQYYLEKDLYHSNTLRADIITTLSGGLYSGVPQRNYTDYGGAISSLIEESLQSLSDKIKAERESK